MEFKVCWTNVLAYEQPDAKTPTLLQLPAHCAVAGVAQNSAGQLQACSNMY